MEPRLTRRIVIGPSRADSSGRLSVADCFALFMDIATEHADMLGIGIGEIGKKGFFWLTVRCMARIGRLPELGEEVEISTWPEKPDGYRFMRSYAMTKGDELLVTGRTQWAVMDTARGRLVDCGKIYPPELTEFLGPVTEEPFSRFTGEFTEEIGTHTVGSNDIDLGRHMNNVAYIRAFQGLFGTEHRQRNVPDFMEVFYQKPCHEEDRLTFFRREGEGHTDYMGSTAEGPCVYFRLKFR